MGKKKNKDQNEHPQKDFKHLVAQAATETLQPFILQQMQMLAGRLRQESDSTLRAIYVRLATLENIIQDEFHMSDEELAELVADTEDTSMGLVKVKGKAEKGDTVRITVSTKTKDQKEYQGTSKLVINELGLDPLTIGPELEPELLGMSPDEVKEVEFGQDKGMMAKIEVNRISRMPKTEKKEDSDANAG